MKTTTDWLNRGIIASMMSPETALIETVLTKNGQMSVAFVNGMPIPYETFSLLMLHRMAPKSVNSIMIQQNVSQLSGFKLPPYHINALNRLIGSWSRIPTTYHELSKNKNGNASFTTAAQIAVNNLFDRAAYGENGGADGKTGFALFGAMMGRIEESYESSLLDPPEISGALDLDDDGSVVEEFSNDGLDGVVKTLGTEFDDL